ncbi:carbonic anhydrase 6-like [Drosophila pseudoobscura]|uniref:carbonic anhydrase n=1 Tax=Drosophila pseudoobscura pseudoobscura TaxID=46245 RepID=A0A6I8VDI2_DROPS|nr:carbonic anhydrase 6 [Drosophila pseudoobscura]
MSKCKSQKMNKMTFVVIVMLAVQLAFVAAQENWLNLEHSIKGKFSQHDWPDVCRTGNKQSPIELNKAYTIPLTTELHIVNESMEQPHLALLYNGYVVIMHNFTHRIRLSGRKEFRDLSYMAEQIHFHCGAEHLLERERHDMEVQIVFRNESAASLKEALNQTKGLVIVSIVFAVSNVPSRAIAAIVDTLRGQSIVDEATWRVNEMNSIFLMRELYGEIGAYYQYHGSSTVPGCIENVEWIVKAGVQSLSRDQMDTLCNVGEGSSLARAHMSYRQLQNSNSRRVFYFKESHADNIRVFWNRARFIYIFLYGATVLYS